MNFFRDKISLQLLIPSMTTPTVICYHNKSRKNNTKFWTELSVLQKINNFFHLYKW